MSLSLQSGGSSSRGPSTAIHAPPGAAAAQMTNRPITTGTSVLGIKYRDGVMLAANTLVSYGSLAKYKNARRLLPVNARTLIGASGPAHCQRAGGSVHGRQPVRQRM